MSVQRLGVWLVDRMMIERLHGVLRENIGIVSRGARTHTHTLELGKGRKGEVKNEDTRL